MCVTGHPLKIHDFWKIASSFLPLRQFERSKVANKHVCEKISCCSFSKTPSTTSAQRFGSLKSSFELFGTCCLFWVQKGGAPGPGPVGPTKQGPCLAQPRQMRRLKMMKYHFFRRLRPRCHFFFHFVRRRRKVQLKLAWFAKGRISSLEWGGESPPTGSEFPAWGGGQSGRSVLCMYVCNGAPPKKSRFLGNGVFVLVISRS